MEPDIKDGSLIFVDKSKKDINDKDIYVINTKDGLYIKHIQYKKGIYHLESINKEYERISIDALEIIGKVKGIFLNI